MSQECRTFSFHGFGGSFRGETQRSGESRYLRHENGTCINKGEIMHCVLNVQGAGDPEIRGRDLVMAAQAHCAVCPE